MDFSWKGQRHRLKGIGNQPMQKAFASKIVKQKKQGSSVNVVFMKHNNVETLDAVRQDMQDLVQIYEDIY